MPKCPYRRMSQDLNDALVEDTTLPFDFRQEYSEAGPIQS